MPVSFPWFQSCTLALACCCCYYSVNPQEDSPSTSWFSRNSFKIAICMCRIKDQQVLICKTYNWIQWSDFALISFGTLVIIMSSCQLNRPFILAPFTSCQVVKVNLFFNFLELLSLNMIVSSAFSVLLCPYISCRKFWIKRSTFQAFSQD